MKAYAYPGFAGRWGFWFWLLILCGDGFLLHGTQVGSRSWGLNSVSNQPVEKGLARLEILAGKNSSQVRLILLCFESSEFELMVIDNGRNLYRPLYSSLAQAMVDKGCVAGINGSLFSRKDGKPKGQMVADGKWVDSYDPQALLDASLIVRHGKLELEPVENFRMDESVTQLIQSNPWIVRRGVASLPSGGPKARRSFVGNDGGNRWILGYAEPCTLEELGTILTLPDLKKQIPLQDVVNLDGGSSAGLWIKDQDSKVLYLKEAATVMNFIGLRPIKKK